jgi:peptidyl-dipeptidase Dcp
MTDSSLSNLLTRHRPLPFDQVDPSAFVPTLKTALEHARSRIEDLLGCKEPASAENTLLPLEACDEGADRITALFYHLLHVDGTPELQALSKEIPPMLSEFSSDLRFNPDLFARIEELWAHRETAGLPPEQLTALENHRLSFLRNGAALPKAAQKELREIDNQLSVLGPRFAEHVLKDTQAFRLWIEEESDIEALPASAKAAARKKAAGEGRPEAWAFTLDMPSYIPFLTYCPNAGLRREMYFAYQRRCIRGENSNLDTLREILTLRHRRAKLLGYTHHANYTLERRMAGDLETLNRFYDAMLPRVLPAARRDLEEVRVLKEQQTGEPELHPWDYAYWSEKLKQSAYQLDQEALRPYFEYTHTLQAVFALCDRLFSLRFVETHDLPVYHDDVTTYRVEDSRDGSLIGHLYLDVFPRSTKRPGAWMNNLLGQGLWNGVVQRPDVAIVANFTPPVDGPSLLTLDEARTLFHEFGHALHELLSECTLRSVSGVNVFWDFVELPSQLMENWLTEPEFLREYARHHETGEPMPAEFIERIQAANRFQKGYQALRQITFGKLDLAWHTTAPEDLGEDLIAFEKNAIADLALFPPQPGTALSPSFQHIFSGGYAAGYYSYKWAEVLEADVFSVFKKNGLFDRATADRLRETILSKGGSRPPMDLFRDFLGREPDPEALLRRDGLLDPAP